MLVLTRSLREAQGMDRSYLINYLVVTVFFFFFFKCNWKYRSIGHRVWSMSLDILTELSFNEKHNSAEPLAQSVIVMQF